MNDSLANELKQALAALGPRPLRLLACDTVERFLPPYALAVPRDERLRESLRVASGYAYGLETAVRLAEVHAQAQAAARDLESSAYAVRVLVETAIPTALAYPTALVIAQASAEDDSESLKRICESASLLAGAYARLLTRCRTRHATSEERDRSAKAAAQAEATWQLRRARELASR